MFYQPGTDAHWYKTSEILNPLYKKIAPELIDVVNHIDYVAKLIGVDHVGIGADWDGVELLPNNIENIGKMPLLTEYLIDRGYSIRDVKKILGENFKRVYKEVMRP